MRVGIVGLHDGHIGGMIHSARQAGNVEIVGVVENNDQLYEATVKAGFIPRYPRLADMITDAKPELILEGINHAEKLELVETAAQAGIHLLLDKPLCSNREHLERMKAAVSRSGIKLSMWFTSRSYAPFMALREHILAGELGQIVSAISTHPHKLWEKHPQWYHNPQVYAGTFHDLACHGVDQIRWLTGAEYTCVSAISASIKHAQLSMTDHVQASFRLSSGACAVVTSDWLTPLTSLSFGDTRFIIMGTEGSAHLQAYRENHLLVLSNSRGAIEPDLSAYKAPPFVANLVTALENGQENFISTADVLAVAEACITAEESVQQNGAWLPIASSITATQETA